MGFRYYFSFSRAFKVFGMINSESIMAQAKLALNLCCLCQLMIELMVSLFVNFSSIVEKYIDNL
jgi:hypothetical protein